MSNVIKLPSVADRDWLEIESGTRAFLLREGTLPSVIDGVMPKLKSRFDGIQKQFQPQITGPAECEAAVNAMADQLTAFFRQVVDSLWDDITGLEVELFEANIAAGIPNET